MTISLDHTVVYAEDKSASARFLTSLFGLPEPVPSGQFLAVELDRDVTLDYAQVGFGLPVLSQHYAFLVSDDKFDEIYGRIKDEHVEHWADPRATLPGQINTNHGGRGVYFRDPSGHYLEILTRRG